MTVSITRPALLLGVLLLGFTTTRVSHGLRIKTPLNEPLRANIGRFLLVTDAVESADAVDASDSLEGVDVLQAAEGTTTAAAMQDVSAIQLCQLGYCTSRSGQTFCQCRFMGCSDWLCGRQGGGPTTDGSPGTNPTRPNNNLGNNPGGGVVNNPGSGGGVGNTMGGGGGVGNTMGGGGAATCNWNGHFVPTGTSMPCGAGGTRLCMNGQTFVNGFCP